MVCKSILGIALVLSIFSINLSAEPVEVSMYPHDWPLEVPIGDVFIYDGYVYNNSGDPLDSVDVWTMAIRRSDDEIFGPFKQLENQYIPRRSILLVRLVHQLVPASEQTHVGVYDYVAYCGNYSDEVDLWDVWDSYSFEVSVTHAEDQHQNRQCWEWNNYSWEHGYIVELQPEFQGLSNYPNPFNAKTTISFDLLGDSRVNLSVYNIAGQKIAELIDGTLNSGTHNVIFDAENLTSGVYFYKLSTEYDLTTKRMILLR